MSQFKGKREIRKLRELIRRYKNEGYAIYADYMDYERPESVGGFIPDLVVKKGDQVIIIEIASDKSLPHLGDKLNRLSEYASSQRGTRFDLVVTNPRPRISYKEKIISSEYLLKDLQRKLFREIRRLYDQRDYETSFLILIKVLESVMKELAVKRKIVTPRRKVSISQLNNILFERRVLSRDDFSFVQEILNYRNRIIHHPQRIEKDRLLDYINFVSTLLKTVK